MKVCSPKSCQRDLVVLSQRQHVGLPVVGKRFVVLRHLWTHRIPDLLVERLLVVRAQEDELRQRQC